MPCQSDYLDPTRKQQELKQTARLCAFLLKKLGLVVDDNLAEAAADDYCAADYVSLLCKLLKGLSKDKSKIERIVYNAHSKKSRELANWWERHQHADRVRKKEERQYARTLRLRKQALAKLTPAERKSLSLELE